MNSNYSIDSNRPAFSVMDDDDAAAAFLNSGSGYLSKDAPRPFDPVQDQFKTTIHKIQDVEQRTLDSSKRCLQAIAESEQVGVETAKDLAHQREQLENTNKRLDTISQDLKESQKNISAIKSVFSSFKQWMTTPKDKSGGKGGKKSDDQSPSDDAGPKDPSFDHNPKLEKAVNIAPQFTDPSLRLRDIDYSEAPTGTNRRFEGPGSAVSDPNDWRKTTEKVNSQLDSDLDNMSFGLSRLQGLAEGLHCEITGQNDLIETITGKADREDVRLTSTNSQINSILKGKKK